jgi:hypothetical protein
MASYTFPTTFATLDHAGQPGPFGPNDSAEFFKPAYIPRKPPLRTSISESYIWPTSSNCRTSMTWMMNCQQLKDDDQINYGAAKIVTQTVCHFFSITFPTNVRKRSRCSLTLAVHSQLCTRRRPAWQGRRILQQDPQEAIGRHQEISPQVHVCMDSDTHSAQRRPHQDR